MPERNALRGFILAVLTKCTKIVPENNEVNDNNNKYFKFLTKQYYSSFSPSVFELVEEGRQVRLRDDDEALKNEESKI